MHPPMGMLVAFAALAPVPPQARLVARTGLEARPARRARTAPRLRRLRRGVVEGDEHDAGLGRGTWLGLILAASSWQRVRKRLHHFRGSWGRIGRIGAWQMADAAGSFRHGSRLLWGYISLVAPDFGRTSPRRSRKEVLAYLRALGLHSTVGREDEAATAALAAAAPSAHVAASSLSPPVLTDRICLILGDDPVVRVEDAPGNARRIFTGIDIRATVQEVWDVLTDYEGLQDVVPNLVANTLVEHGEDGGARLWQIGRVSWSILGRDFSFQAGMMLDVRLHPTGLAESQTSGEHLDASALSSAEARSYGRSLKMVRGIFPRPFSIAAEGVPVHDITMQNVPGERGDFTHYQGVWRMQPLPGCALPGQHLMRLTFAVEVEPHWFLPVAPVEGRIAMALAQNMEAIRSHVESQNGASNEF